MFFHLAFPAARVCCYEPSPANVVLLRKNLAAEANVELYPFGLSDRDEQSKLFTGRDTGMQSSVVRAAEQADAFETVELRRASMELAQRGLDEISILKVDTEGCEVPILRDLGDRLGRVDFAYIEYHSDDDRLAIDALMRDHFILAMAQAIRPHRGMLLFISRRLMQRYPELEAHKITLPPRR